MLFLTGVFAHLEMLEARAREAAMKQVATEQRKEQLAMLEARVQELRQRRDELRAKVELQEQGVRKAPAETWQRALVRSSCQNVDLLNLFMQSQLLLLTCPFLSDIQSWCPLFSVPCSPELLGLHAWRLCGHF